MVVREVLGTTGVVGMTEVVRVTGKFEVAIQKFEVQMQMSKGDPDWRDGWIGSLSWVHLTQLSFFWKLVARHPPQLGRGNLCFQHGASC